MAEGVLFDLAWNILELIGSPALQEIQLASSVKHEIRKLTDTVTTIKAVLIDAEKQHNKNEQVTLWLRRLKDVLYDAGDLLDDFSTELLHRKVMTTIGNKLVKEVRIFFSNSNQFAFSFKMGHRIKSIRERLDEIEKDRKFHLNEQSNEVREREKTHSFVIEEDVIGREDDKIAIKKLLWECNDGENVSVSVIPIVGLGGLGKTTLVQYVYNDVEVKVYFELQMWVCVSNAFDVKVIVENIIKSATDRGLENLEMDQLQGRLRKEIDGKRYLLVLDDVWEENRIKWLELKSLLKNGARGSKIIVTTRSETVAKITNEFMFYNKLEFYPLKGLTEDKSWSLFVRTVFKQGVELKDSKKVELGKEIVAMCVGVPLVIRVVGNLLRNEGANWASIKDELMSSVAQKNDILKTLKLSYDHLPSHLKQCFAYCALFLQDHEFKKEELINLWMAQGFLQSSNRNQCLEDVGNECFMSLLSMSFFQDAKRDEWGNIIGCKMHDLMHDLARLVAGIECTTLDAGNVDERARHISFYSNSGSSQSFPSALLIPKHIRTFLLPYAQTKLNDSNFLKILSSLKCLRTLNLSNSEIEIVPSFICKLKNLRYLDLSENSFTELPNSMCSLRNLQTLGLDDCDGLKELPRDFKNMVSLKHLMNKGCYSLTNMPKGLGVLTSLQTLSRFVVAPIDGFASKNKGELIDLKGLNNLKGSLEIEGLGGHSENGTSTSRLTNLLKDKKYLQSLTLCWDDEMREVEFHDEMLEALEPHPNLKKLIVVDFGGLRISTWLSTLTNLTTIEISWCKRCQHLPPLDQLPYLEILELRNLDALEYISSDKRSSNSSSSSYSILSTPFFPSLKRLLLYKCPNLKGWWKRDDDGGQTTHMAEDLPSFPCLSILKVEFCPKLTSMPLYPSLEEELKLWDTSSKPLHQTMMMSITTAAPSTSSSTFSSPLSKLQSLYIISVNDLKSLSVEWLQNLTSLVNLTFYDCNELELLDDENGKQCQGLASLRYLKFYNIQKLVSLPNWLQPVITLQHLHIHNCFNLMVLPEWIHNLTSLLQLDICGSPYLSKKCGSNTAVYWPNIAHIPNIQIDGKKIQLEGVYQLNCNNFFSSATAIGV